MEIKRNRYLNRLIGKKNNGLVKVITGIRRSGKSYLLFNLYYDYLISVGVSESNIILISLDDEEYTSYCNPHELYEYIKSRITDKQQQGALCRKRPDGEEDQTDARNLSTRVF